MPGINVNKERHWKNGIGKEVIVAGRGVGVIVYYGPTVKHPNDRIVGVVSLASAVSVNVCVAPYSPAI